MNRLKRLGIIMVILGIMLGGMAIGGMIDNAKPVLDYENLKISQLEKGKIVEGDVKVNLGCFEESYSTRNGIKSSSSSYYYAIFAEEKVIALKCPSGNISQRLDSQANAFLSGAGESSLQSIHIKGKVKSMDSETKKYLEEYLYDAQLGTTLFPIETYVIDNGMLTQKASITMLIIGIVLIAIPLAILILSTKRASASKSTYHSFDDDMNS